MHLTSHTRKSSASSQSGCLYIVATPLGNLADITLRALDVLRSVDVVAAEDTRKTRRLLGQHGIQQQLVSYHEHNEQRRTVELVTHLEQGRRIALVSDAGTPGISDPGYRLVHAAANAGIKVVPIPGVSALTAALSAAGLPTDTFVFSGFAPKKTARRRKLLETLAALPFTIILYESPLRMIRLLDDILDTMGDRYCVVAREMTKLHEEFLRGRISEVRETLSDRNKVKGECTVLISGRRGDIDADWSDIQNDIQKGLGQGDRRPAELAGTIAAKHGVSREKIYREILRQKKESSWID
jgi:16S rRNA (cytidine1402-2'-O)-methyltransferase